MKITSKMTYTLQSGDTLEKLEERLQKFSKRESTQCPRCLGEVSKVNRVRGYVYANPCGCKLWHGPFPKAWK